MYKFKIWFRVRGSKNRRSIKVAFTGYTLFEAWELALKTAVDSTGLDEILDSICQEVNN